MTCSFSILRVKGGSGENGRKICGRERPVFSRSRIGDYGEGGARLSAVFGGSSVRSLSFRGL